MTHRKDTSAKTFPPPRFTGFGARYLIAVLGGGVLALAAALDFLLYLFFAVVLERCYGIWCLI